MFCSNCGKQLEDGVRFCKYCGAPTSHSEVPGPELAGEPSIKQENSTMQEEPRFVVNSSRQKKRKGIILAAALIATVVIVAGVALGLRLNSGASAVSSSYALPELPDGLHIDHDVYDYDYGTGTTNADYTRLLVYGQSSFMLPDNCQDVQFAENGTIAVMTSNNDGVLIYREGVQIGEIPGPVNYFYLSGSGEKIVYGTSDTNSYLWNVSDGKGKLVSDTHKSYFISYDGSVLNMGEYYSENGKEPIRSGFEYFECVSPNGKYIYGVDWYRTISGDDITTYHTRFGVRIDGLYTKTIFSNDSDPDGYLPYAIACSQDYKEILFRVHDDIYYYSVDDTTNSGYEAQVVGNVSGGALLSLNEATTSNNIFNYGNGNAISSWLNDWTADSNHQEYRTQRSIQNGVFCLLKEQNGIKSASLVRLVDGELIELIPNITGNVCLSKDETKLWCVADGRVAFCDLSADTPRPVYCNAAYVRAYTSDGSDIGVGVSGARESLTAPIAATSDGETVCFISVDGTLWMCTPETVNNPKRISDNAFWVQCSANDEFYLMKGNYFEYFEYSNGRFCDLYVVDASGTANYQYGNVVDMFMTKSNVYIAVGRDSDSHHLYDTTCALYCEDESGYRLVYEGCSPNDIHVYWWAAQYW